MPAVVSCSFFSRVGIGVTRSVGERDLSKPRGYREPRRAPLFSKTASVRPNETVSRSSNDRK